MQITPMGDSAMLAELGTIADEATLDRVLAVARALAAALLPGVTDIVPAFTSVTVHYDLTQIPPGPGAPVARVAEWLRLTAAKAKALKRAAGQVVEVPVCYGGEHGPDLPAVARRAGLSEAETVKLHSNALYRVAAVGFAPGFPYLLGLPERLEMPRRATPRVRVPSGSVGIGGAQTGVYPFATPGGWQLIGRTPLTFSAPKPNIPHSFIRAILSAFVPFRPGSGRRRRPMKKGSRPKPRRRERSRSSRLAGSRPCRIWAAPAGSGWGSPREG